MAYKFQSGATILTGSITGSSTLTAGDIYNRGDAQGNTYLDWDEDYLGVVTAGNNVLVVSGSTVGIGTASPDYTLDVAGAVGIDSYIYHNGDADTYLKFTGNEVNIVAGAKSMITLDYNNNSSDKIILNNTNADIDVQIMADNGEAVLHADAGTNRVGIGQTSPTSTFEISGSQAGNYAQSTGNLTFNETHYIVDYTGNGDATFTLPDVSGITGRVYHILCHNQSGEDVNLTVTGSGGEFQSPSFESGDQTSIRLGGNTPQSITVVSTGGNWFVLNDNRSQHEG